MYCGNCGQQLHEGARFCWECGASTESEAGPLARRLGHVPVSSTVRPCPACGAHVEANAFFCGECGKQLIQTGTPQTQVGVERMRGTDAQTAEPITRGTPNQHSREASSKREHLTKGIAWYDPPAVWLSICAAIVIGVVGIGAMRVQGAAEDHQHATATAQAVAHVTATEEAIAQKTAVARRAIARKTAVARAHVQATAQAFAAKTAAPKETAVAHAQATARAIALARTQATAQALSQPTPTDVPIDTPTDAPLDMPTDVPIPTDTPTPPDMGFYVDFARDAEDAWATQDYGGCSIDLESAKNITEPGDEFSMTQAAARDEFVAAVQEGESACKQAESDAGADSTNPAPPSQTDEEAWLVASRDIESAISHLIEEGMYSP